MTVGIEDGSWLTVDLWFDLIVYGPGKDRFSDFIKVGGGLTLLSVLLILLLVPVFWPL